MIARRPAPAERSSSRLPALRLLGQLRGLGGWVALALLLGVATVALNTCLLALAAYVIAAAALHPALITLSVPLALVRFCGVARAFARYAERLVSHDVTFRVLARLRGWFYARLEPLAPARLLAFRSGDLLARLVEDVEELENVYGRIVTPLGVAALTIALAGATLWTFDAYLALVAVVALLLAGAGVPLLAGLLGRAAGRRQVALRSELQAALVDGIQGLTDLLAFGRETDQAARLAALDRRLAAANRRMAWVGGLQAALGEICTYGTLAIVLALAIPQALAGRYGAVYLAAIAMIVLGAFEAVTPLGRAFAALGRSVAAGRRILAVADLPPAVTDRPLPIAAGEASEQIVAFEQVSFRYTPGEPLALDGVSFAIAPGERVAIIGPSGAGKSTIVRLLLRFWDPSAGTICLAGHDLRDNAQDDARRAVAVAAQDGHLFGDTLRNNLLLARPDATDGELLAALERATLGDLLRQLPHCLDTWIGEQGLRLSGGERQRLILARAFLRDAQLTVLDEPAAGVDPATEAALMAALHAGSAGHALLVITHRLVRMEDYDTILVLNRGRIVERGTHRALLARRGLYWRLYAGHEPAEVGPLARAQ
jgi:ATP-binding cassette subfamily C protein CydC